MRQKGIGEKMMKYIKKMHVGVKFGVKCGNNEITDFVDQRKRVRQGCSLSPYLL
jgi:hypothetical protein